MQITLNNADIRAMDQKVLQTAIMLVGQGILNAARKYGCFDEYHEYNLTSPYIPHALAGGYKGLRVL